MDFLLFCHKESPQDSPANLFLEKKSPRISAFLESLGQLEQGVARRALGDASNHMPLAIGFVAQENARKLPRRPLITVNPFCGKFAQNCFGEFLLGGGYWVGQWVQLWNSIHTLSAQLRTITLKTPCFLSKPLNQMVQKRPLTGRSFQPPHFSTFSFPSARQFLLLASIS